ncbi:MAG: hypothetical protein JSV68_16245 [Anaerolineaceae bacterium]|nr:MAG: hypothetical protein JSV68_16245 [Anaerolineaceae bacterium]
MQIELIGCTSAGKSTLVGGMLRACKERGQDAVTGDDFVLKQARLNWVKGYLFRTLLVDLLTLSACLATLRTNLAFYKLTLQSIWQLPAGVGWFERLNIARNVFKKVGIHKIICWRGSDQQIVLLDEGTIHTAHYLFVHVSIEPNASHLSTFIGLVPLPDVIVYVQNDADTLVKRTLSRGHRRLGDRSPAEIALFVERAIDTFNNLTQSSKLRSRLLILDASQNLVTLPDSDHQLDPSVALAADIVRAGVDPVIPYRSPTMHSGFDSIAVTLSNDS